ncbi:MAG: hypothetical protein U1E31_02885 [Rickettsiales bacterium]
MKQIFNISCIILICLLSSCSKKYFIGTKLSKNEIQKIENCKKIKCHVGQIYQTIGFPVITEDNKDYFIGIQYEQKLFFKPKIIKSQIIEITLQNENIYDFKEIIDTFDNNLRIIPHRNMQYHDQTNFIQKYKKNVRKFVVKENLKPKARLK